MILLAMIFKYHIGNSGIIRYAGDIPFYKTTVPSTISSQQIIIKWYIIITGLPDPDISGRRGTGVLSLNITIYCRCA